MTKAELLKALRVAWLSASADDATQPGTEEKSRHMRRLLAMDEAYAAVAYWMPDGAEV